MVASSPTAMQGWVSRETSCLSMPVFVCYVASLDLVEKIISTHKERLPVIISKVSTSANERGGKLRFTSPRRKLRVVFFAPPEVATCTAVHLCRIDAR